MTDPWADPSSDGTPYGGPPQTAPPPAGQPGPYAGYLGHPGYPAPYGYPGGPYGHPAPWGPAPGPWGPAPGPRRPGQVVAAAVLTFVQAAMVLIASFYVFFFASIARVATRDEGGPVGAVDELATEGTVLAFVQLLAVVVLVVGGIMALGRRRRPAFRLLVGALAVQVLLAIYWGVRLSTMASNLGADLASSLAWFSVVFAALPGVALGLLLIGPGRRWFRGTSA